jgi:hypothetical protein
MLRVTGGSHKGHPATGRQLAPTALPAVAVGSVSAAASKTRPGQDQSIWCQAWQLCVKNAVSVGWIVTT